MGTNLIRAMLLASGSVAVAMTAMPAAAYAQEASYQIDIPAQAMGDALRALGRATKQNIVFDGAAVRGKRSVAVKGRVTAGEALQKMLSGSGLVMARGAGGALTVQAGNAPAVASPARAGQGQGLLVGSVRDHKTGAALKGARVEIVETGENTATGDLGDFRFARLPTGEVTLRISYLGFPEQTETVSVVGGLTNRTDIYLGSGATTEIVVIGQVSARAQALNQERTAENSTTVISGDLLGNFNGTTVSDSLRRAPGVSFIQDQRTGDGTNIMVRGMTPDYNQVKLNGVPLPEGSGTGRAANLNSLLSDSVSEIRISKTLMASQDSSGSGGLVEIETKSPLDRPRRYFNIRADGTKYGKGFGDEYLISGTASMRFGSTSNFGISASMQYRKQSLSSYEFNTSGVVGAYLPLAANGQPATQADIDPRTPFPLTPGGKYYITNATASRTGLDAETQNISASAEWQISSGTNLRLDYIHARRLENRYSSSLLLSQPFRFNALRPIAAEGGAPRYTYFNANLNLSISNTLSFAKDVEDTSDSFIFRGESAFGGLTLNYVAGHTKGSTRTPEAINNLTLGASLPIPNNSPFLAPVAIDPATGGVVTIFGPRTGDGLPEPLLSEAGFSALNNATRRFQSSFGEVDSRGSSQNYYGDLRARYDLAGMALKYVEAGVKFEQRKFVNLVGAAFGYSGIRNSANQFPSASDLGLVLEGASFRPLTGQESVYRSISPASARVFFNNIDDYVSQGLLRTYEEIPEAVLKDKNTVERDFTGFVQARADVGKIEIIGGIRFERSSVKAFVVNDVQVYDEFGEIDQPYYLSSRVISKDRDSITSILPRVLFNFRPNSEVVVRAGYYSTIARPAISQLNSSFTVFYSAQRVYGPTSSQPSLQILKGNPGLRPAHSHNFDIGAEWYDESVGVIKVNGFLKRISNLIENNTISTLDALDGIELPDHPSIVNRPDDTFVRVSIPSNNSKISTIWGVDFAFERRLEFLPGILSGLGVYANFAYNDSSKTITQTWGTAPVYENGVLVRRQGISYELKTPFAGSTKYSGTFGATYSKYGLDATLYYTYQPDRLTGFGSNGLDAYNAGYDSLDFRMVYGFKIGKSDVRISLEGRDLLKGSSDYGYGSYFGNKDLQIFTQKSYFGGRKFAFGISAGF